MAAVSRQSGMEWWTDPTWEHMHKVALAFDKAKNKRVRETFVDYVKAIHKVLLCPKCQMHFGLYIRDEPIVHGKYFEWTWKLHNLVNQRTRQPLLSLEKARAEYDRNGSAERLRREMRKKIRKLSYHGTVTGVQTTAKQPPTSTTKNTKTISRVIWGGLGVLGLLILLFFVFK